ncbi:putative hotdog family 3-hydroxylacyl-ACP dehydratase [Parabacteroides sp. PFB2-12]|nr:pseudouridylate synthase [Parabacteroides sp. PFB2-12]MDH6344107.1 putative hotdog family 3-hydroxylacyl-ACP dehydratase [Parabacteroides sp. PM6-13]MDH6391554.1 putative hotdog family 3-hydroxylacyl-ACP dehydratase [Parabacteroides sp. PFB2-12]
MAKRKSLSRRRRAMKNEELNIDARELLPQKGRFVMVDRLIRCDEEVTLSTLSIREDNIFIDNGRFLEAGILEHMAQTAAARNGYIDKYVQKGEVKLGFIGEIKNVSIERCPAVGETLTTSVTIVSEIFSTLLIHIDVTSAGEPIASGDMKIAMTTIVSQE